MATRPRRIFAGSTYLVTRRCSQRQFLLRPCERTDSIFLYVLAVAASRFQVKVHAYCVMSNHFHLVVTDTAGQLPAFGQYLDSLVARATNCFLGRWESFWDPASYSAVELLTPEDVIEKCAYVLANPVAAGLVRRGQEWPGLWSGTERIDGEAIEAARPKVFFSETGSLPKTASLKLVRPPGFDAAQDFAGRLRELLHAAEVAAAEAVRSEGRSFLGAARILGQKPSSRPAPGEPRRALSPRVGSRDRWRRCQALQNLGTFIAEYCAALEAWRGGVREVVFPAGTYLMRLRHAVCCAAPA